MEEYLNLYHQKLWEIAYENLINTFFNSNIIFWFVLFLFIWYVSFGKKRILLIVASYFFLFLLGGVAEYVNSYDKIMNPNSIYNVYVMGNLLKYEAILPMLEHVDKLSIASVDGKLKREDIIVFGLSNPTYYHGLFSDTSDFFSGEHRLGKSFVIAVVGYEEKDGKWQSVDIRIAPGDEEKDLQKFSKVLHIKEGGKVGTTHFILTLQRFYELRLWKEKNGYWSGL